MRWLAALPALCALGLLGCGGAASTDAGTTATEDAETSARRDAAPPADATVRPGDAGSSARRDAASPADADVRPGDAGSSPGLDAHVQADGGGATSRDADAPDCSSCATSTATARLSADTGAWVSSPARARGNALRGFLTSYLWGTPVTDFPDQMEFLYVPMRDLWGEAGATLETGLEPLLAAAAARAHHVVLRVYVDYPSRPSGLPPHLESLVPCSPYTEHGGGCSPDYDDPDLLDALRGLIGALGARYDGDPRLGFVQAGLLGFWGEWHTWPHADWFASDETQRAVLDAYEAAFPRTQLQVRYPAVDTVGRRMGFHDDSFAYSTLGDLAWFFLPSLEAAGADERWQEVAIGGELRPELQAGIFSDTYEPGEFAQDIHACIAETHASYLLNYYAFNGDGRGYVGDDRTRAEAAADRLGYRYELRGAVLELSELADDGVNVTLAIAVEQTGVAPFYYPLFVEVDHPALTAPATSEEDLGPLLPGETATVTVELGRLPAAGVTAGFDLRLDSPQLLDGQRVRFATATPETLPEGPTRLRWEASCEIAEGGSVALGSPIPAEGSGCPCRCDVDGEIRRCDGSSCSP